MDLFLPSLRCRLSTALSNATAACPQLRESQLMWQHLIQRLQSLSEKCHRLGPGAPQRKRGREQLASLVTNVVTCQLRRHEASFVKRLAGNRKVEERLREFHEEMDKLEKLVPTDEEEEEEAEAEAEDWRLQWGRDRHRKLQDMRALTDNKQVLVAEKSNPSFVEGLFMLKFEIDHRAHEYATDAVAEQQLYLIKRALSKLIGLSSVRLPPIPDWFIPSDDVDFDPNVYFNCGSYGSVHRGTWHKGTPGGKGAEVVVKCLLVDDDEAKQSFYKEVDVWQRLDHPHVLKFYGACHVSKPAFFVCDDATHGNFAEYFEKDKSELWRLFYEVALGLGFLHAQKVVHGDLKCTNLLVGSDYKAKVCDFGFSYIRGQSVGLSAKTQTDAIRWKAPECLAPEDEDPDPQFNPRFASDVFSFGMCIIETVLGEAPYGIKDDEEIMDLLFEKQPYPRPNGLKDDEWALVERLTDPECASRITLPAAIDILKTFADREGEERSSTANTRKCSSCRASMPARFSFCGECGASMTRSSRREDVATVSSEKHACPSCDESVHTSDRYCRQCGCLLSLNPAFA